MADRVLYTNDTIRAAIEAAGWENYIAKDEVIETVQRKSYWFNNTPGKLDMHLQLIEDLTQAGQRPRLYMHTHENGWLPIYVEDLAR